MFVGRRDSLLAGLETSLTPTGFSCDYVCDDEVLAAFVTSRFFRRRTTTPAGQQVWTGATSTTWTVPAGVTSICILCVGKGADGGAGWNDGGSTFQDGPGGGGGGLSYANNVAVTPGESLTITIDNTRSRVRRSTTTLCGAYTGGSPSGGPATGAEAVGDVKRAGGDGGAGGNNAGGGGGGGAAGYSGNGGAGGAGGANGSAGSGGGGGGGAGSGSPSTWAAGGGGVGLLGEGSNGAGGTAGAPGGRGGSGGSNGGTIGNGTGGNYGAGGGGGDPYNAGAAGGAGAIRIIYGTGRSYPSTNTGDV